MRIGGRPPVTLRHYGGTVLAVRRPATVNLRPSAHCRGPLGRGYSTTDFALW